MSPLLLLRRAGNLSNFASGVLRSNFGPAWRVLNQTSLTSDVYTAALLRASETQMPRISRFSAHRDYPTLEALYDESRTTYARLLPRKPRNDLPPERDVAELFRRTRMVPETNRNSSLVFPYYAQWFTHQFFNTRADSSPHTNAHVGFNLSQLYGTAEKEQALREHVGGRMRTITINGAEYAPVMRSPFPREVYDADDAFDIPVPLLNLFPGVVAIHTIMLRNHNRNAARIAAASPGMSDDEIFQKAKLVCIAQIMKITMEDYVNNHILSTHVRIRFRPEALRTQLWHLIRPASFAPINAIPIEFNFLYRWHQLMPDSVELIRNYDPTRAYDSLRSVPTDVLPIITPAIKLPDRGVEAYLASASLQRAGKLTLLNTASPLVDRVILPGVARTRDLAMASYNDYRELFGMSRMTTFEEITDDKPTIEALKSVYRSTDDIEFYPGVFAEEKLFGGLHGALLSLMGVSLTYAGIFTSRLLQPAVWNPATFSPAGWKIIQETETLRDIVGWNSGLSTCSFQVPAETPVA